MSKIQYDRLLQDTQDVINCIALLKQRGETEAVLKLKRKLEFIESHIADIKIA